MAIEEKIPRLQESLRKSGFPRLGVREIQTSIHGPDGETQQTDSRRQWEFINKENTASVLVDAEGFTYQVTQYDVFETFGEAVRESLAQFAQHVEPNLVQRIGLRYVDLVVPADGKEIRVYFSDSLRGFKIDDADEREAFFSESVCRTGPASTFIHRYVEASRGFGFPPDLLPTALKFNRDPRMESPFGLLDLDHSITLDVEFAVDECVARFDQLHQHQTKAFRASVTDSALEEWK